KATPGFIGSLSFDSDQALGAITLRESRNAQNEPMYTTLPVASLETTPPGSIVFPQIAVGDGYTTQLVMINTTDRPESGQVRFITSAGNPLAVSINGVDGTTLSFGIAPNAVAKIPLTRTNGLAVGYAVITADPGVGTPAGSAIFQVTEGDSLITEAGVGASPATTAARIFVDYAATRTGMAIANPSDQSVDLTFTLMDRFGNTDSVAHQTLAARNHAAMYVHELLPSVVDGFTGLLDIRGSGPIVPITLKLTINSRDKLVLTTLPVADLTQPAATGPVVFPHLAIGSGFSTHLILLNSDTSKTANGS